MRSAGGSSSVRMEPHATAVRNSYYSWQELYSCLSDRLESQNDGVALIVSNHGKRYVAPPLDSGDAYALFLRLVHGSLARAGKVKSQTPKVEAQEKKKIPKGRAKKRMLYNRRYVLSFPCPCAQLVYLRTLDLSMSPPYSRVESDECECDSSYLDPVSYSSAPPVQ